MQELTIGLEKLIPNENNPRKITEAKLNRLKESIQDFGTMLELRPILVDDDMVVLGGNMRLRALTELGYTETPYKVFTEAMAKGIIKERQAKRKGNGLKPLTKKELSYATLKDELVIKDNVGFGVWDWEMLTDNFTTLQLEEWGMDVITHDVDLDDFFEEKEDNGDSEKEAFKIVLEFSEEDYAKVSDALGKRTGSAEKIFFDLLGL